LLSKIAYFKKFIIQLDKCREFSENVEDVITHPIDLIIEVNDEITDISEFFQVINGIHMKFKNVKTLEIRGENNDTNFT
jgi:hypothetical protein